MCDQCVMDAEAPAVFHALWKTATCIWHVWWGRGGIYYSSQAFFHGFSPEVSSPPLLHLWPLDGLSLPLLILLTFTIDQQVFVWEWSMSACVCVLPSRRLWIQLLSYGEILGNLLGIVGVKDGHTNPILSNGAHVSLMKRSNTMFSEQHGLYSLLISLFWCLNSPNTSLCVLDF